MKGIIFTEFLTFAEAGHGDDFVDDLVYAADLPGKGIFTSVGTYDFSELVKMLSTYCQMTRRPLPSVLREFGQHLVVVFRKKFPELFGQYAGTLSLLNNVEDHIHVEVLKLYPDAELPSFDTISYSERQLVLDYTSCRALSDLAVGLIQGVADLYRENVTIETRHLEGNASPKVRFTVAVA